MSLLALPVVFDCALTFFVFTNNVDLETSDKKQIPNGYLREQIRHRHGAKLHQSSRHLIEMSKFMVKKKQVHSNFQEFSWQKNEIMCKL